MSWSLYLLELTTGRVGRRIEPKSFSWSDDLNAAGGGEVSFHKSTLVGLDRRWYTAGWGGVVLCYRAPDGQEYPYVGGPINGKVTETLTSLSTSWSGLWEVFDRRVIERDLTYRGSTYGEIAWALAQEGMNKPGGSLPLVHGVLPETGTRERTYKAYNLANNAVAKRWGELTEVIAGPDIVIRPRWADANHTRVEWVMLHGTNAQPEIAQDWTPDWDTTVARSDVSEVSVTSDPDGLVSRVWGTGAGEDETTVIVKEEDLTLIRRGYSFAEAIISDSDQDKPDPIRAKARGHLKASQQPADQITMTVRADSEKNPLNRWHVGHAAYVSLSDVWDTVPAGRHLMRIVKVSGDLTNQVTVEFQVEQLGG